MATAPKRLMRRQTDLTRLADQFRKNIEGMTGQYQTAFGEYQKSVAEQLAPYEEAVRRYKEQDIPAFERAKSDYESRLEQFNQALADYESNPTERIQNQRFLGGRGQLIQIEGKTYSLNDPKFSGDISIKREGNTPVAYRDRPIPKMSGGVPQAPSTPERPAVAEFDSSQFEQKRAQLQQDYTREVGERRSAKLAAVRRTNRTLMRDM
jgi:hypothetical protein